LIDLSQFISSWNSSYFAAIKHDPWQITSTAPQIIGTVIASLGDRYRTENQVAVHRTATVETGAIIKGPAIIGPDCFVAATAYLRGGVFLDQGCIVGPGCELKTTFMFKGSKIAHLSFVGDSILGADVNIEAGAMIANYRNENADKRIRILTKMGIIDTGVDKFGALIGDDTKIGANAVVAPGAIIAPGYRLARLGLIDQSATAGQQPKPVS